VRHVPTGSPIQRALELLARGEPAAAEALCREVLSRIPAHAEATHILGLVRKQTGQLEEGERLIRASIQIAPARADFQANLANLLVRRGRLAEAETHYREAVQIDQRHDTARLGLARTLCALGRLAEAEAQSRALLSTNNRDAQAWSTLGSALREQQRLDEAESAFRRAIELQPQYAVCHHNLGALLSGMERAEEAIERLEYARRLGAKGFELSVNLGRALLQLYRLDEAERAYAEAVALQPLNLQAQLNLTKLRYMRGDARYARDLAAAIAAHPRDIGLQMLMGDVLRRAGDLQGSELLLRDLLMRTGPVAQIRSALACVLHEVGRLQEAEEEARAAVAGQAGDPAMVENLVAILLSRGDASGALGFIREQRSAHPHAQNWIAYEATAARLLGDPMYRELCDYDRFVRVLQLEPPPGWSSLDELNTALMRALHTRHPFVAHPLDQSLRHGSQTARSLRADPDPAIRAILIAFVHAIDRYRSELGCDEAHPFTSRNRGHVIISGCWSVRLHRGGFHLNHVHPEGWLSSAYYVSTPPESEDPVAKSGWLKFGEPRFPVPGCGPERFVQPRAGTLVLFPSYMWHGTNPIREERPRICIAFDAVTRH
jgi:Flp pilus assembly protein TadD